MHSGSWKKTLAPLISVGRWFDTSAGVERVDPSEPVFRVEWARTLPLTGVHLMCLGVLWVGWSPVAVGVAVALYWVRMFAVTGFLHRYFSHRTFKTSRWGQLVLALAGASAAQRGPLWWASQHRKHHLYSDTAEDPHSPQRHGFLWSHIGWIFSYRNYPIQWRLVPDLARYPELRFVDRFEMLVPVLLGVGTFVLGVSLSRLAPELGTTGLQMLIWGFFISTVALAHGTFSINSLAHRMGRQRYRTSDDSRNSFLLSLLTMGEGWHNNHHHYAGATRQGFFWWEVDLTYYLLVMLSWTGLIWDLKPVPARVRDAARLEEPKTAAA
ncbi:MAG: acyl-CoA desaturase [Acidobacteria bacterium]|nr:acyl-CoA desaturase [Acidobacteriota bacterium]